MSFLRIDVSKSKNEEMIKITLKNQNIIQVNFSKLYNRSNYLRDKYKFSEALPSIQTEIDEIERTLETKDESIIQFFQLIEDSVVDIPIEQYKDIYVLSQYFCIPEFIDELDNIREKELYKNINFTIQILIVLNTTYNKEMKFVGKIEDFLATRINECIENPIFKALPISTIDRIINNCNKNNLNFNLFIDFILESIETRFVLLRFLEINKLEDDKINKLFQIIEEQEEDSKKRCMEFLPLDLSFIKQMKFNYDKLLNEMNEIKEELNKYKKELMHQRAPKILVCGCNNRNALGEHSNYNDYTIYPPLELSLDISTIASLSFYYYYSVLILNDGSLYGAGLFDYITNINFENKTIKEFKKFSINGSHLNPVSAVCCASGALFLFSKNNMKELAFFNDDGDINISKPIFLDIGNHRPIALFGGFYHLAAICSEGEIIFINPYILRKSQIFHIEAVYLPNGEKASSIACCSEFIVALSSTGRVFISVATRRNDLVLNFKPVDELANKEIIWISGTDMHCFAISKEGRVYGYGSNSCGKLGLGIDIKQVSSFTEVLSLNKYEIKAAYAGSSHSFFQTPDGKILSCGNNENGELLLKGCLKGNIYFPIETNITGTEFCIAGYGTSVVFIGFQPKNMPNRRIDQYD